MFCRPLEPTEGLHILRTLNGHKLAVNLRNYKSQLFLYLEELKRAVDSVMQIYLFLHLYEMKLRSRGTDAWRRILSSLKFI